MRETDPVRLQLSRRAGFDLQELSRSTNGLPAVNVARPSKWGNPFRIGKPVDVRQVKRWGWAFKNPEFVCEDAATAVRRFRGCIAFDDAIMPHVIGELRGKNLACWCERDVPCHADVLMALANSQPK